MAPVVIILAKCTYASPLATNEQQGIFTFHILSQREKKWIKCKTDRENIEPTRDEKHTRIQFIRFDEDDKHNHLNIPQGYKAHTQATSYINPVL